MNTIQSFFIYAFCLLSFSVTKAQKNLILNGGFEDTLYCAAAANNIQQFKHWYNPTKNGSHGYGPCVYQVHNSAKPHSGKSCAAAASYWKGPANAMQYIAGQFAHPLEAGKTYCFSMYVRLYWPFKYGSNNLAVFLDHHPIHYETMLNVPAAPALTLPFTAVDTNWVKFNGIFTAQGGETDFMIGGYLPYNKAFYPLVNASAPLLGSQFIYDDLSLTETPAKTLGNDLTLCAESDSVLLGDSAWVATGYKWYANGTLIDSLHSQLHVRPTSTTTYILQSESCQLYSDTITLHVIEACSQSAIPGNSIPNVFTPNGDGANDAFTVPLNDGKLRHGTIYNRWGTPIYTTSTTTSPVFQWDGRTASGDSCHPGTYYYVVSYTNAQNEEKTIKGFFQLVN